MKPDVSRRPGRPKSAAKAVAIREAAVKLFMRDGMERTSMDAVANAAGVSKQTVYSHFRSKDQLFRACVASKVELYELDASQLPADVDADTLLTHVGRQYLTLLSDPGVVRMFRLMVAEAETHPATVHSFHETGPVATRRNIGRLLALHLRDADGDPDFVERATDVFLSLVKSHYFLELLLGTRAVMSPAERDAHIARCIEQFRRLYRLD